MNTRLWLTNWKNALLRSRSRNNGRRRKAIRRQTVEVLEQKTLLTGVDCFGQIDGITYNDLAGDGVIDAGDPRLSFATHGVQVHLFEAGVNDVFESAGNGGVALGDDVFIGTAQPNANGEYSFADLPAGTYFVEQPTPAGFIQRTGETVSGPIEVTATDAEGTLGVLVDDFTQPVASQSVVDATSDGVPATNTVTGLNVLGSERDLSVDVQTPLSGLTLSANQFSSGLLEFSASANALGTGVVTWDGGDGDATVVDVDGLNPAGIDLTNGGATTGFRFDYGGDKPNQVMTLTVYSTDGNSASETFTIPDTGGAATAEVYSPFSDYAGLDFTDVGAIELRIDSTVAAFQLQLAYLQTIGPTVTDVNFANFIPMTLGGTVFGDTNNSGTFQTLTESGINQVAVTLFEDLDRNGTFAQLATATTAGGGDYEFTNLIPGDYYVQLDASNFAAAGPLEDLVSSTGNGVAPDPDVNEDDNDDNGDHVGGVATNAVVTQPITLINNDEPDNDGDTDLNTNYTLDFGIFGTVDIQVTKSDNVDPVTAGSGPGNLIYTVTAFNDGPLDATGVEITDALLTNLPTGWVLDSAVGSNGTTYNNGVWTIGSLADQISETLTVTITVGASAVATTTTNTAEVTAVNETDDDLTNNTFDEDTTVARSVDIQVTKSDNIDPVTAGSGPGNLVYTVMATNNGPSDASGVAISDALLTNLPTGWVLDSAVGSSGTTYNNGVWTIGNLADEDSETLTVTISVGATALATTTTNTAEVTAVNETDRDLTNNTFDEDTTVARSVDIQVTKSDNIDPVTAGSGPGNLVYTVTATNNGPSDASGVAISDALLTNLPTGWVLDSAVGSNGTTYNNGVWTIGNLADEDSETLTVTISVGPTALATTTTNTAEVTAINETDRDLTNNTFDEDTTVARSVDIQVTKSDNIDPVTAGSGPGNLVYTVTARNNGPSDASGVTISDALLTNLPVGWTLDSAVGSNGTTYNNGVWTIGNLADEDSETLTVTITVDVSAAAGTTTNTATVTAVNETDRDPSNNSFSEDTTVGRIVDIQVTKSDNVDPVTAGSGPGNLVYTVTAFNDGPSDATGVEISDALLTNLPTGWVLDSAVGSNGTTYNNGVWTIGSLANQISETLTVTITVGASAAATTTTNTAEVTAVNETDDDLTNNTFDEDTTVDRSVDIQVTKSDNIDPVTAGSGPGNLVYTVMATNNGPSDASGVAISDALLTNLPVGWTLDSAVGSNGTTYNNGVWTIGNLADEDSETLTVTISVGPTALATTTTNTAEVTAVNETDRDLTNNTFDEDTTVARSVDIQVTKSDNIDPVTAGSGPGNLVYTVTATNNGPSDASGVAITDALLTNLPTGWVLDSAVGSNGTTYNNGVWTIGNLADEDSETLTVTISVGPTALATTTTNTAEVTAVNETDRDLTNNTFDEDTTVARSVDIQVTKSDNIDPVTAGSGPGNLVYTVTARNNGPSDASGVTISDALLTNLPVGWILDSAVGSNGTTYNNGVWTIGNLADDDSETLTVTITVGVSAAAGTTTNTATVSAVNETDRDSSNNTFDEDTTVARLVDIQVTKSDNNDPVTAGSGPGNLVYTITAFNDGPSDASGVQITDPFLINLPSGITLDSAIGTAGSTFNTATGIWTIGNLADGDSRDLTVTLTVGSAAAAGTISNVASVSAVNETDNDPSNDTATEPTVIVRDVDLAISKTDSVDPVNSPGQIQYTIRVDNVGTSDASGVIVTDTLSALVTFAEGSASQGSTVENGGVVTSTLGDIAAGGFATVTIVVNVDLPMGGTVSNVASVVANEAEQQTGNNTDDENTTVNAAPSSIAGVVYQDLNNNGVQDPGESPIANVLINLFGEDTNGNTVVRTARTDSNGAYLFEGLLQGNYSLFEVQPGTYVDGTDTSGTGATATTQNDAFLDLNLAAGANAVAFNFGEGVIDESKRDFLASNQLVNQLLFLQQPLTGTASLSGNVALDRNLNGVLDAGDTGLAGATVSLAGTDSGGNTVLITRTTDTDGSYAFNNLAAGTYSLIESQPPGFFDGTEEPGSLMSDSVVDDVFAAIALPAGGTGTGFNFLEQTEASVVTGGQQPVLAALAVESSARPTLSWPAVEGATRYEVWVGQVTDGVGVVYHDEAVTNTSVQLPVELALGVHRLWVRSIDASGRKADWSEPVTFTASPAPQLTSPGNSSIDGTPTFNWTAIAGAVNYDLAVYDTSGQLVLNVEGLTRTSYTNSHSLPVGNYRAWVRARNQDVTSDWGHGMEFSVVGAPVALKPPSTSVLAAPLLEWSNTGANEYEVWLNDITESPKVVTVQKVQGTSLLLSDLLAAGQYRYWVRGTDADGNATKWSAAQTFEVAATTTVLAPVGTSTDQPTFSWTPVAGATHYDVWVSNSSGLFVREQSATTTQHTFTRSFPNGDYRIWVRPVGVNGQAEWSESVRFTVGSLTTPTVSDLGAATNDRTPTITWSAVPGATRYELWVNHVGVANRVIHQTTLVSTSFMPTSTLATGAYRIWVRALGSDGMVSQWSSATQVTLR